MVRDMDVATTLRCRIPLGSFFGRNGSNLQSVERRTGAVIHNYKTVDGGMKWLIFYPNKQALSGVKRAMGY